MSKPTPLAVSAPVRRRPIVSTDKSRREERRTDEGEGLHAVVVSPSPNPLQREVWQTLLGGLHSLTENDHGRPWPYPQRNVLARLLAEYDEDLCRRAAQEAREIVQSQDRAPNITGLFEKKLRELAEVRAGVRGSLASAGEGATCL